MKHINLKKLAANRRLKETAILITGSLLSTGTLLTSLLGLSFLISGQSYSNLFLMGSFIGLALTRLLDAFYSRKNKLLFYSNLGLAGYCLVIAIISIFSEQAFVYIQVIGILFALLIIATRVFKILAKKKIYSLVMNALIVIIGILLLVLYAASGREEDFMLMLMVYIITFIIIAGIALKDVIYYVFGRIKTGVLKDIVRKTYAGEILLGLAILILSFSLIFYMMEDTMESYTDALWYSFCIVTTIGLGDKTCTTNIGRVLSVILGIYGIVVVALITSIIVNFYNEASEKRQRERAIEKAKEENELLEEIKQELEEKKEEDQK